MDANLINRERVITLKILIIVILMDLFIFTISLIFVDNERQILEQQNQEYHMDRYGYSWKVHE
ncbi:hypothetical protein SMGD1_0920 [Sulfurimonas gotlandica GD1]|uniref:Uncharacterized protein n=1 Tax=Sulfurimonas gotlandica (strain DSM 19862 / JCM 16533 / GD1) TaxID=929558 RepID=B6BLY0_SULGG|nr:hypothetical protein [Sulfurimonas gotlandica]EDZ61886.1 hypothetical protein CBGD1_1969 [Sulfurimonas gotlandica GD1]EHP29446.1 hypothetical protein SMGD1_0920 [Sulfurimonas gotlandica GD1]